MATSDVEQYSLILEEVAKQRKLKGSEQLIESIGNETLGGSILGRLHQVYAGLNSMPDMTPAPMHKEMQGLVLFTRPDLNFSYGNLANIRDLSHLLSTDPNSISNAIRFYLDFRTQRDIESENPNVASALVDSKMPYISLLSNTITSLSAPPDIGLNVYTSQEGIYKEQWIANDSIAEFNGKFDLTATFENVRGNGALLLLHAWIMYISHLRIKNMLPHPANRIEDRMDYFTRIERFKFDESGRKIEQWWHCGAAMPTNVSIGSSFAYNREQAYDLEGKTVSTQFACVGSVYQDPIQLYEFNLRMEAFNPGLKDDIRDMLYIKVPYDRRHEFNGKSYPHIDLATNEMNWWTTKKYFNEVNANGSSVQ